MNKETQSTHFHIRWPNGKLDWEPHKTRSQDATAAQQRLSNLPLIDLLTFAASETDCEERDELIREIDLRYQGLDPAPSFEVFWGVPGDRDAAWIETVTGLAPAYGRMQKIAAKSPGVYYLYHSQSHRVFARLNNRPIKATNLSEPKAAAG